MRLGQAGLKLDGVTEQTFGGFDLPKVVGEQPEMNDRGGFPWVERQYLAIRALGVGELSGAVQRDTLQKQLPNPGVVRRRR